MIKRIIFDVDNTLIMWDNKYLFALRNVLEELMPGYTDDELMAIDGCIETYEQTHDIYTKEAFVNYINNKCNTNLGIDFIEKLIIEQGSCYEEDSELVSTIKYLKEKYDLVVLSNWFADTQKLRLQGIGILDDFTLVSGGDERLLKPNPSAFDVVLEGYEKEECLMIGDSLRHDIVPATLLDIPCIWITDKTSNEYKTCKDVYQLKKIL